MGIRFRWQKEGCEQRGRFKKVGQQDRGSKEHGNKDC
jgi:hypothetical protein